MTFTSREPNVGPEEAPGHVLHLRVKSRTNAADLVLAEAAGAESLRDAGHLAGADAAAVHLDRKHGPCFGGYCDMLVDKRERRSRRKCWCKQANERPLVREAAIA